MAKFRKAPDGEWPGFPYLKPEDVSQEHLNPHMKHLVEAWVENRKGRVVVKMEGENYQRFLAAVRKKHGNIWAKSVNGAALMAIEAWVKSVEEAD